MTRRSIFTSIRRAMPLNVEDWAALSTAFPSTMTITKVAFYTGSAVVTAVEALQFYHTSVVRGEMESFKTSVDSRLATIESLLGQQRPAQQQQQEVQKQQQQQQQQDAQKQQQKEMEKQPPEGQ